MARRRAGSEQRAAYFEVAILRTEDEGRVESEVMRVTERVIKNVVKSGCSRSNKSLRGPFNKMLPVPRA